jgi:hypothetical protein
VASKSKMHTALGRSNAGIASSNLTCGMICPRFTALFSNWMPYNGEGRSTRATMTHLKKTHFQSEF